MFFLWARSFLFLLFFSITSPHICLSLDVIVCGNMRPVERDVKHTNTCEFNCKMLWVEYTAMYIQQRISQWLLTSLWKLLLWREHSWAFWIKNLMSNLLSRHSLTVASIAHRDYEKCLKIILIHAGNHRFRVPYIGRLLVASTKSYFRFLYGRVNDKIKNFFVE